jgi:enoyl ACP reductase
MAELLEGRRLLITGVMTRQSIAWNVALAAQERGAEVLLTSFGRARRLTERAAKALPEPTDVLELDVTRGEDFEQLAAELERRWGKLDGVLHAIGFAPGDALGGNFLRTPPASATAAIEISAISLKELAAALLPLLRTAEHPGIVALDFDASQAWPKYDWMGVAKAALESVGRYLARDLGPDGVRVNLISAGPLKTPAASGVPGFDDLAGLWRARAPLGWDLENHGAVADAACFLFSPLARGISGEIIHVDGGLHAVGAAPGEGAA